MRIAMFTDTYTPQVNGVVTSIQSFKAELEKRGHEVHVWAPTPGTSEKNVHRISAFKFAPYPEYRISVPNPNVLRAFAKTKFDIVHVHTPISLGTVGVSIARHFKIPIVGTFHTMLPEYMHYIVKGRLQRLFMRPAQRFAWKWCARFYNFCNMVIAPSEGTARVLARNGVKRITIIPTGIGIAKTVSSPRSFRRKHRIGGKMLLHVGRVTREKNIEAIINILPKVPNVTLVITSDGPYRAELERYVERKDLSDRVIFTGYLSKTELATAYAAADLFVCASKSETQGIVLLEAAASGLPIVALDAPVTGDFVRENNAGIVTSADAFSESISIALGDEKLRKRVRANAKTIARKYDARRCTNELVKLYENLVLSRKMN